MPFDCVAECFEHVTRVFGAVYGDDAVTAAIAMQRSYSAASDQPVARIEAIRCPNADSE